MRRLLTYVRPYKLPVVAALVLLLFNAALQVSVRCSPRWLSIATWRPPRKAATPSWIRYLAASPWTGLAQISFLYLLVVIFGMFCDFGEQYIMQWVGQKAMFDLRREMMARLQRLDLSFYDHNPVGRLVTRITTDVDALNELFSSGLLMILGDLLMLSFVVIAMLELSPGMTAISAGGDAAGGAGHHAIPALSATELSPDSRGHRPNQFLSAGAHQRHRGAAALQSRGQQPRRVRANQSRSHGSLQRRHHRLRLVLSHGGVSRNAGAGVAAGLWRIPHPRRRHPIGVLVAFFQYGMRFFRPIQDLSEKYNILQSAMAASERVFKLLDTPVADPVAGPASAFPRSPAAIEFDHVWFAYKDEDWVLSDVSFRIEPGETIAVVGHTGAGKTTITSLLLRFYEMQRGAIRIGGIDIREFDLEELRRNFGVVLQDPHLFTGTIADNIRLGTAGISDEQISDAAERVNLLDFVQTCRKNSRSRCASAAPVIPPARSSSSISRGLWRTIRATSFWTKPLRAWTPKPNYAFARRCSNWWRAEPPS